MSDPASEARTIRHRQADLAGAIDRSRRDGDGGASACIVTPVRLPSDSPWPPELGSAPGGVLRRVAAVTVSGPMAPGSTLTATVSPAWFLAVQTGGGVPPDPTATPDPTTWLYALATQVSGRWYYDYRTT